MIYFTGETGMNIHRSKYLRGGLFRNGIRTMKSQPRMNRKDDTWMIGITDSQENSCFTEQILNRIDDYRGRIIIFQNDDSGIISLNKIPHRLMERIDFFLKNQIDLTDETNRRISSKLGYMNPILKPMKANRGRNLEFRSLDANFYGTMTGFPMLDNADSSLDTKSPLLKNAISELNESSKSSNNAISELNESSKSSNNAISELNESSKLLDNAISELNESSKSLDNAISELNESSKLSDNAISELNESSKSSDNKNSALNGSPKSSDNAISESDKYFYPRVRGLQLLKAMSIKFEGGLIEKADYPPPSELTVPALTQREHDLLMQNSKIAICFWGNNPVTYRLFEGLANRCFVMTQSLANMGFKNMGLRAGEHYVEFRADLSDLAEKVEYYLAHAPQMQEIADAGYAHFRKYLSWRGVDFPQELLLEIVNSWSFADALNISDGRNLQYFVRKAACKILKSI